MSLSGIPFEIQTVSNVIHCANSHVSHILGIFRARNRWPAHCTPYRIRQCWVFYSSINYLPCTHRITFRTDPHPLQNASRTHAFDLQHVCMCGVNISLDTFMYVCIQNVTNVWQIHTRLCSLCDSRLRVTFTRVEKSSVYVLCTCGMRCAT